MPVIKPLLLELQHRLTDLERKHDELERLASERVHGNGHHLERESTLQTAREEVEGMTRELSAK